jgi:NAD(P)-dependent dehydrogenase (short-subunit alcohol dehydrogenase family)
MTQAGERKSIFITGAGSGIGRATAALFAARGWFCGLYDVNAAGLEETARALPAGSCVTATFDVRDRAGWAQAVAAFSAATGGRMHVLFNNAGIARHGRFEDIPAADRDLVVDVNLKGVLNGVEACLALLEATPDARIVNVASVAGFIGAPMLGTYVATKFAVRGLSEALDAEFAPKGIRVVCLAPWFVETPILNSGATEGSNRPMSKDLNRAGIEIYPVSMAADRAWDAAHGEEHVYTVGKAARQARFMARFFPGVLRKRLRKGLRM